MEAKAYKSEQFLKLDIYSSQLLGNSRQTFKIMKNNTRKTNSYTQGHQLTARVLLILWLFGSCGLGSTLAAPKRHDQHVQTSPRSSSLPLGIPSGSMPRPAPKKNEDLRALINTIKNNESWIGRQAAVKAIGQLFARLPDNKRAIALQALISAAKDPYIESYEVAIETLQQFSTNFNADERKTVLQELEGLITHAERSALHVRLAFNGILEICQEQPNDSYDFLAKATKSPCPHVRQPAFETIGKLLARLPDNKRAIALQALIDASKAQESNVRQAVVWAFGQNLDSLKGDDHSKAFQALIDANADQESNVRQAAVWALGQNFDSLKGDDHSKAFQALIDANADQESNVRQAAVWVLAQNLKSLEGDDHIKALEALIDASEAQDSNVRQAAVWDLNNLAEYLKDKKSLEGDDPSKALQALIEATAGQDSNVRQAAVEALGQNLKSLEGDDHSKAFQALIDASKAQDSNVLQAAVEALGQNFKSLEGDDHIKAFQALIDASKAQDSNVLQAAVEALGQNFKSLEGDDHIKALEALIDASNAQDSNVRQATVQPLNNLAKQLKDKLKKVSHALRVASSNNHMPN